MLVELFLDIMKCHYPPASCYQTKKVVTMSREMITLLPQNLDGGSGRNNLSLLGS